LRTFKGGLFQKGWDYGSFTGHPMWMHCVAFTPDGRSLVTASMDGSTILWDVKTGQRIRALGKEKGGEDRSESASLSGRENVDPSIAISSDGETIVTSEGALWDVQTGKKLRTLEGENWGISSLAFSPDGRTILAGSSCGAAMRWDARTGKRLQTFKGHVGPIRCVAFGPDGRTILTGCYDGSTKMWSVATGENLLTWFNFDKGQDWLVVTPDGLYDGSLGGVVKVHYRVGEGPDLVPAKHLSEQFHRPGLVAAVLRRECAPKNDEQ